MGHRPLSLASVSRFLFVSISVFFVVVSVFLLVLLMQQGGGGDFEHLFEWILATLLMLHTVYHSRNEERGSPQSTRDSTQCLVRFGYDAARTTQQTKMASSYRPV